MGFDGEIDSKKIFEYVQKTKILPLFKKLPSLIIKVEIIR